MLSALGVIIMMTAYFPYFTYCSPMAAGALLVMIVIEFGSKWAVGSFVSIAILSLLLGEKEAACMFLMFFGYYPILKAYLERIRIRFVEYILKFAVFNIGIVSATLITVFLFKIPIFEGKSNFVIWAALLLIAGNIMFLGYDIALRHVITFYYIKIQPKIRSIIR